MDESAYLHPRRSEVGRRREVVYHVEGGSPNALYRQGWRKDTLKVGDVVTVTGNRAKNPESVNIGQATITTADGHKVFAGTGPAGTPAAGP